MENQNIWDARCDVDNFVELKLWSDKKALQHRMNHFSLPGFPKASSVLVIIFDACKLKKPTRLAAKSILDIA